MILVILQINEKSLKIEEYFFVLKQQLNVDEQVGFKREIKI